MNVPMILLVAVGVHIGTSKTLLTVLFNSVLLRMKPLDERAHNYVGAVCVHMVLVKPF